jgi:hypothetical protein
VCAGGEARIDILGGFGWLLIAAAARPSAVLLVAMSAVGLYLLWRGIRSWRKPYAILSAERIVVFHRGQPRHYVPVDRIASIQRGFNCTRLLLHDGSKIKVSHLGFLTKTEAERFRTELQRLIDFRKPTVPA